MTMNLNGINNQGPIAGLETSEGSAGGASATGNVDSCGALLPAPSIVTGGAGGIGAEIALLSIRAGQDEMQINTAAENAENNIEDAADESEVIEMHNEASDIMNNAYGAAAMQIVQGAMQITGGCVSSNLQPYFTGGATLSGAGSTIFNAQGQAATQIDQSIVLADKAVADRAGQISTEASQGQSDARSVISNAIQFCQEYEQTKSQIDLAAAGQKA
jgi:hypothetical protein